MAQKKKSRARVYLALALCAATAGLPASAAQQVTTGIVTVIVSYAEFGNGDFAFRVSNQPAACYGFWLSPSQPGFKTSVAFILKAHTTGEAVLVGANDAQIWNGSGSAWCKVEYVGTPY